MDLRLVHMPHAEAHQNICSNVARGPKDPRTLALRRSAGRWVGDPQDVCDGMATVLRKQQVGIMETFWKTDEEQFLALVLARHPKTFLCTAQQVQ